MASLSKVLTMCHTMARKRFAAKPWIRIGKVLGLFLGFNCGSLNDGFSTGWIAWVAIVSNVARTVFPEEWMV